MPNGTDDLTPTQVLDRFRLTGLTRDLLYFWARKGWIKANMIRRGRTEVQTFPPSELGTIAKLLWGYALGFNPDSVVKIADGLTANGATDSPLLHRFDQLLRASEKIAEAVLLVDCRERLDSLGKTAYELMDSESCAVLLSAEGQYLTDSIELAARVGDKEITFERVKFGLSEPGPTLELLARQNRQIVDLHGTQLSAKPADPERLSQSPIRRCFSLLYVPLVDRKNRLLGCLRFQNKKGLNGQPGEDNFYDPFDRAIANMLASQILVTLETLNVTKATRELLQELNESFQLPVFMSKLLGHAVQLVDGDYGDIFWRTEEDKFTVLAQKGSSFVPLKGSPPVKSVTRRVAESLHFELIPNKNDSPYVNYYANCRPDVISEVAIPMIRKKAPNSSDLRDRECVGVLNVESRKENAFDLRDVKILEYLSEYAIPELKAVEKRQQIYDETIRILQQTFEKGQVTALLERIRPLHFPE